MTRSMQACTRPRPRRQARADPRGPQRARSTRRQASPPNSASAPRCRRCSTALDAGRGGDGDVAPRPPEGRRVGAEADSLAPVAQRLSRAARPRRAAACATGSTASTCSPGQLVLLENCRMNVGEKQGRRGAGEEDSRAVRRVRHGRLRHRAPRAGLHARRDPVRAGRLRRPAADGRARRARQGARQPDAAAAGDRRRLQGQRPSSNCCRRWSARSTS